MQAERATRTTSQLPVELTRFIGRERELTSLRQLMGSSRLLTLTGAGGSGKSRLALELVGGREHVAWVSLAPITDAQLIPAEILRSMSVQADGGAASLDAVVAAIGDASTLLVLDNCEHLVEECAGIADRLLRECPELRILATSREALGVGGERAWLVPPLSLAGAETSAEAVIRADAVQLFVERARDVVPGFAVTAANAAAVAGICARLDGIPLAIELAAARVRHLTPEQIRDRLGDVFTLLTSGSRTALPRHRTLRATIDWSYELLPDDARVVLRRLAIFRGGFTLDSVEGIVAGDGIAAAGVLDLVALLVDRSMVVMHEQAGTARYDLLEAVRQYAAQRLQDAGEQRAVQRRYADYFATLVAELEPAFLTRQRRAAFARLEPELDNLREVLQWTRSHDAELHVAQVGRLWWFWYSTRHWPEAARWIEGARALPEAERPTRERAALLFAAGALSALRAQVVVARGDLRESAELAARVRDDRLEAYALNYLGMTYAQETSHEALDYSGRAEKWFRENADAYGLRLALLLVGLAHHANGDSAVGLENVREAVVIARSFGQDRELGIALQMLGKMLLEMGRDAEAEPVLLEALHALRRDASDLFIGSALEYLAIARGNSNPLASAFCFGAADAMRAQIGARRFQMDEVRVAEAVARIRERLGDAAYDSAHAEGSAITLGDAADRVLRDAAACRAAEATEAGGAVEHAATDAVADLEVRALGRFSVRVQGVPIESWAYARPRELLVHLLMAPRGRTRDEIGAALWPDASAAQVRNSFHVTMHHLRKALGHADWVVLEEQRYRVAKNLSVKFDVADFERDARAALADTTSPAAVQLAALERALGHYNGHLLDGEATGSWRDEEQDRLRALYADVGLRLGSILESAGRAADAAALYEKLIAVEPLLEEAQRHLMRIWIEGGERPRALRHYQRFVATLTQLELEPDPETEELFAPDA